MQISDQTKAGIVDALGGVGVEMAKEFVLRQRQQQAMEERKEMEMELAETRARAMNQSSVDTATTPDAEPRQSQRSSTKLGGDGSFQTTETDSPDTPTVSSELAQRVVQELSTKSRAQQQVGYREVKTFDNLVQQDVSTEVMRDAMEDFSVITPIIADVDVS